MLTKVLLLASLLVCVANGITVHLLDGSQINYTSLQIFWPRSEVQPLSASISSPVVDEASYPATSFEGKIAWIRAGLYTSIQSQVRRAQSLGAIGVLCGSGVYAEPGGEQFWINELDNHDITIPILCVGLLDALDFTSYLQQNSVALIDFFPSSTDNSYASAVANPWFIVWQVSITAIALGVLTFGIIKFGQFIRVNRGFKKSIAQYVLLIDIIGLILRVLATGIDPWEARGAVSNTYWVVMATGIWVPFPIASSLLIILYWQELMSKSSLTTHPFLTKLKIPFYTISTFILIWQITLELFIVNNFADAWALTLVLYIVSSSIYASTFVLYSIIGAKLFKKLKQSPHTQRNKRLAQASIRIIVSGVFQIAFIITFIAPLLLSSYSFSDDLAQFYLLLLFANVESLMRIMTFHVPKNHESKTRSKSLETQNSSKNTVNNDHNAKL